VTAAQVQARPDRLAELEEVDLKGGSHNSRRAGMCAMEAVAWLADEDHSDRPECVCPVIGAAVRNANDRMRSDDERNRWLRPLLPKLIGTRGDRAALLRRGFLAADWAVRVAAPIALRARGLTEQADSLAGLPEIVDGASAASARDVARAAASAAAASAAASASAYDAADAAADAAYAAYAAAAASAASRAQVWESFGALIVRMAEVTS
jgi:hypothetical protein